MPSIFIAVQCFQCSTMQVKQQAKAGNKWMCAVCNVKQSVRKIFARGPMAKDIRKFVQEFNMSRKFTEELALHSSLKEDIQTIPAKKRRSDWSEYLELPENCSLSENEKQEQTREDELEGRIVTEFPEELFKKPKLKKQLTGSYSGGDRDDLLKPVFSKRNKTSGNTNRHVGRKQNIDHMETKNTLKLNTFMAKDQQEPRSSQMACISSGASKWSKYMTEMDDSDQQKRCKEFAMDDGSQINYISEAMSKDEEVEDEIHPDFK